jgi:hypothetical protein
MKIDVIKLNNAKTSSNREGRSKKQQLDYEDTYGPIEVDAKVSSNCEGMFKENLRSTM